MEFDCAFVFPIVRPVVLRQAQVDRCAVDCVKRIVKLETMSRRACQSPVEDFLEKRLENIRAAPVHGVGESGFRYGSHTQVVEAVVIGRQPADNFTQRIFAGNLSIDRSGTAAMRKNSCNNGRRTSFLRIFQNDIGE